MNDAMGASPANDLQARVIAALKTVRDPEIPLNIYDLGLVYNLTFTPRPAPDVLPSAPAIPDETDASTLYDVAVVMTLTTPACPMADILLLQVRQAVENVSGVGAVDVDLVWDPPWDNSRLSEEARLQMNMLW